MTCPGEWTLYGRVSAIILDANRLGRGRLDSVEWEAEDAAYLLRRLDAAWRDYLGVPRRTE